MASRKTPKKNGSSRRSPSGTKAAPSGRSPKSKAGAPRRSSAKTGQQIDAVKHKDKRKNIPTEELRNFMTEEAQQPHGLYSFGCASSVPSIGSKRSRASKRREKGEVPAK